MEPALPLWALLACKVADGREHGRRCRHRVSHAHPIKADTFRLHRELANQAHWPPRKYAAILKQLNGAGMRLVTPPQQCRAHS